MGSLIAFIIIMPALLIGVALSGVEVYSQTSEIKGTVTDENKKPVEFVTVTIHDIGITTLTDSKGSYRFSNIQHGNHLLTFKRNGYESKSLEVAVTDSLKSWDVTLGESLIETPVIEVTGSLHASDISQSTYSITELNSHEISRQRSQTLAETIQNIPGVNNISTGISLGKPVIRGLSFQSVLVVRDGIKTESQMWGDEHGPEISIFDLDRIEILRGPASLMFGADGIGGVVNVISKPLQFSNRKPVTYGELVLGGFSVNNQFLGNLTLGVGTKNFGVKGHFGYRKAQNVKTPDGTLTVNTFDGTTTINGGELWNSGSTETEGGANLGFSGKFGNVNLSFATVNRGIQMHDEDSAATGNQKLNTSQFSLQSVFNINKKFKLEPVLSYQKQERKEFESIEDKENNITALDLKINTFDATLHLHHDLAENLSGTFGAAFTNQTNESLAEEKLIPNYTANSFGIFLLEKLKTKFITFSVGGRFDTKIQKIKETVFEVDSLGNPSRVINPQDLSYNTVTGSFGIVYTPVKNINVYSNIGRGWRPPSEFELFVDGEHEGTGRYDRGLRTLDSLYDPKPEQSLNLDLGFRINYKNISVLISGFRNQVDNFVYPSPTGDTLNGLPVYNIRQAQSTFIGFEYSVQFQLVKWIVLSADGDYVKTENKATGNPLPFTPPMKNIIEIKFQKNQIGRLLNPYIKLNTKIVSAQNNVDPLETKTAGYTLFNAGIGFDFILTKSAASVDFSVDNIVGTKYVDHLSRYRGYAMNPGRSYNLKLTVPFKF